MVATTTVKMELDGSMSAQSQIETIPSAVGVPPSAPTRTGLLINYFTLTIKFLLQNILFFFKRIFIIMSF